LLPAPLSLYSRGKPVVRSETLARLAGALLGEVRAPVTLPLWGQASYSSDDGLAPAVFETARAARLVVVEWFERGKSGMLALREPPN